MTTSETFLIAMVIILSAPYFIWRVLRTDFYAPLVVVQIIGGILIGPGVLGAVFPDYYQLVFSAPVIAALNGIAWWAVMLFVWNAGIELDLSQAWALRRETAVTASLALLTPLVFGCLAAAAMLQMAGWIGTQARPWQAILGIGMACAVTALPILVLFLDKLAVLRGLLGQRVLRYASVDDVAIWGVLALILLDWERIGRQAGFMIGFALATIVIRALMRRLSENDRWYVAMIWLAASGFAADWAGTHFMVGAFLAGAVLDAHWFDQARRDQFQSTILLTLMPVFFLSTGIRTRWDVGGMVVFGAAALLLLASVSGKLVGVHIAGRLLKWPRGEAGVIGWLLQTKALIMIIFANILLDKQIITGATFTALLLMAVGSTMLTIPMVTPRLRQFATIADRAA